MTLGTGAATEPNAKATIVEAPGRPAGAQPERLAVARASISARSTASSRRSSRRASTTRPSWAPAARGWMLYEPFIRRAAGLGKASFEPDPDRYETAHAFCDVLVVGGGPAGLSAALAAGRAGARVILCDDSAGARRRARPRGPDRRAAIRPTGSSRRQSALNGLANVRRMTRTSVYGYYDDNVLGAVETLAPGRTAAAAALAHRRRGASCSRPARSSGRSSFPATTRRA